MFLSPGEHVHRPAGDVGARGRGDRAHALPDLHERLHVAARPLHRHRQELRDRHPGLHPRRPEARQETPAGPPRLLREAQRDHVLVSRGRLPETTGDSLSVLYIASFLYFYAAFAEDGG